MNPIIIFPTLESILQFLSTKKDSKKHVQELLDIYEQLSKEAATKSASKKHPLIVMEGLDGSGKSTVGLRLAARIKGEKLSTPPDCISHLRRLFDDENDKSLRTAFYSLGNYMAALELEKHLIEKPIVLDRFWHSTAAIAFAQAIENGLNFCTTDDLYTVWPKDLLKPDVVFFLDVSEDVRLERLSRRKNFTDQENLLQSKTEFRQNIIKAYKHMRHPEAIILNGDLDFDSILKEIDAKINYLFL